MRVKTACAGARFRLAATTASAVFEAASAPTDGTDEALCRVLAASFNYKALIK